MPSENRFLHRPLVMEARGLRKKEIDTVISKMIAHNQSIALKILTFLNANQEDGYMRLGEALPNILSPSELGEDIVKELSEKARSSEEQIHAAVKKVREQVRDLRIAEVGNIDASIAWLNLRKQRLLLQNQKYGTPVPSQDTLVSWDLSELWGESVDESVWRELTLMDTWSIFDLPSVDTSRSLLVTKIDSRIPAIPVNPLQFGTIAELEKSWWEITAEAQVQLRRARDILPRGFDFTELTPAQLKSIVTDMERFISPESKPENVDVVLDFIEAICRKGWRAGLDEKEQKALWKILRAKKSSMEEVEYTTQTIMRLFGSILSDGIWVVHLIERNIWSNMDVVAWFVEEMRKPFISNWIPEDYRAKAWERAENARKLMCLVRVLERSQTIYTQRLSKIVPFYRSITQEILKFYVELEWKMEQHGKKMRDYFNEDEFVELGKILAFIRSVDGGMEQFWRISPKQELALRERIFWFQQTIQSRIEAYPEFDQIADKPYIRVPWDVWSAYKEILIRLYDRWEDYRTSRIWAAGALRFPQIDAFVAEVTRTKGWTFISKGWEAVEACLKDPSLLAAKTCPLEFRKIIELYIPA